MKKVAWGVLSTANIGMARVIPAMQQSELCSIDAICSLSLASAREAAQRAGIPRAYGSYEELLADPALEAIYNPLPNHLHVDWTIMAMQAGKHVLCEKPLGMTAADAARLLAVRDATGMKVMEAFATRVHPQWLLVRELVQSMASLKPSVTSSTLFRGDGVAVAPQERLPPRARRRTRARSPRH